MRVPRVIIDAQEYRADVLEVDAIEECEEDLPSKPILNLTESKESVKDRTNYALLQLYYQKGYDAFKKTCLNMKGSGWVDKNDYGHFKGEVAEVYLYVTVLEFIEKFQLPWTAHLSLVVPHRNGKEKETTEIDLALVSEEMITVFEAKSYGGLKKITGICTVTAGNKNDVYRQNALHCESLLKQIEGNNINGPRGMKSVMFSFSEGDIQDNRQEEYKRLMPILTEDSILAYLSSLTKLEKKYWNKEIFAKMEDLSKRLTMDDHLKHVTGGKVK